MLSKEHTETPQTEDTIHNTCGVHSVDVLRVSKTKLQIPCNIVQIKRKKTGKVEFFADTIPVFLMCGSEDGLISRETTDEEMVVVLTNETGKILSILADFLLPGNYLINKPPGSWERLTEAFKESHPEDCLSLNATSLSPYLSSVTDPMKGHHVIMIDYAMLGFSFSYAREENTDLSEVVQQFESLQTDGDLGSHLKSQNSKSSLCDNLYYCMIMSCLRNLVPEAEHRKKNFQMRIKYADAAALKEKKKIYKKKYKKPETNASGKGPVVSTSDDKPFHEELSLI